MARAKSSSGGSDEPQLTTLYAPDGREYKAASAQEVTRLKAAGYSEQAPAEEDAEPLRAAEDAVVLGPPPPPTVES